MEIRDKSSPTANYQAAKLHTGLCEYTFDFHKQMRPHLGVVALVSLKVCPLQNSVMCMGAIS